MIKRLSQFGLATIFLVGIITACSKKTTPTTTKPYQGPEISYASDVAPIIKRSCAPCHFPDQKGKKDPLDNYKRMKNEIMAVIGRVELDQSDIKFMPYKMKKPALSDEEIKLLKNWAQGGFSE